MFRSGVEATIEVVMAQILRLPREDRQAAPGAGGGAGATTLAHLRRSCWCM